MLFSPDEAWGTVRVRGGVSATTPLLGQESYDVLLAKNTIKQQDLDTAT